MTYADRLKQYCNQTVLLEKAGDPDSYGNIVYLSREPIKARKEANPKYVRSTTGETVVSNATVFSLVQIDPLDRVDGNEVINSMFMTDKAGRIIGWEAWI